MTAQDQQQPPEELHAPELGVRASGSWGGCALWLICLALLWAGCFGVTVDGKHYGLDGCSCDGGLKVDTGQP